MFRHILLATIALTATNTATAQTALTDLRQVSVPVEVSGSASLLEYGYLRSAPNEGTGHASLEWLHATPSAPGAFTLHAIALPLHRVGSLEMLPSGQCLVVGRRFTNAAGSSFVGNLTLVDLDVSTPALGIVASVDIGAVDPLDVCYDGSGGHLFLIDGAARSVVAAAWSGTGALPSSFGTVVDSSSLAGLERPRYTELHCVPTQQGVRVYENDAVRYTRYTSSGPGWTAHNDEWQAGLTRPVLRAASIFLAKNQPWELEVFGPAAFPLTVEIAAEGGVSTDLVLTSTATTIAPPSGLVAAGDFGQIDADEIAEFGFRTCHKFGEAQNASFFPFGELYCDFYGPWSGRDDLVVAADVLVHPTSGMQLATALNGALWIAVAPGGGPFPLTQTGTSAVLTPLISVPFSVPAGTLPTELAFRMPAIPMGSEGLELLFQVVVTDGSAYAYTGVFGIEVRAFDPWTDPDGSTGMALGGESPSAATRGERLAKALGAMTRKELRQAGLWEKRMLSQAKRAPRASAR